MRITLIANFESLKSNTKKKIKEKSHIILKMAYALLSIVYGQCCVENLPVFHVQVCIPEWRFSILLYGKFDNLPIFYIISLIINISV